MVNFRWLIEKATNEPNNFQMFVFVLFCFLKYSSCSRFISQCECLGWVFRLMQNKGQRGISFKNHQRFSCSFGPVHINTHTHRYILHAITTLSVKPLKEKRAFARRVDTLNVCDGMAWNVITYTSKKEQWIQFMCVWAAYTFKEISYNLRMYTIVIVIFRVNGSRKAKKKEKHVSEHKRRNENDQNMKACVRLGRFHYQTPKKSLLVMCFLLMSYLFPLFANFLCDNFDSSFIFVPFHSHMRTSRRENEE